MQYHTLWVSNRWLLLFLFSLVYAQNQYENSQRTNSAPTPLIWEIILNPHKIHLFLVMLVTLNKYVNLAPVKEGIKSSKITLRVTEIVGAMFIIHLQIMKKYWQVWLFRSRKIYLILYKPQQNLRPSLIELWLQYINIIK